MSALLAPDTRRIGRPDGGASPDRAPDWVARGTPERLRAQLIELLGADRVLARASDLIRYASDASPYRKIPKVVVMAHDGDDVAKVLAFARDTGEHVTFRGGGTSLNGQGQTDAILVDVRRHFSSIEILDGGSRAKVRGGMLLGLANRHLAPTGHRLGPDPASTDIATVGGVVANNSGGMRCGVTWDSYSTVEALTFATAGGTRIDTSDPAAEERFAAAEPELAQGLMRLREQLMADDELVARIRRKYAIKNVTGYRLDALLDGTTPLEIFRRLIVGSEGTLAFIADATFRTRPEPAHTTVAWVHTEEIDAATGLVPDLVAAGARAAELMVGPALIIEDVCVPPERIAEAAKDLQALLGEHEFLTGVAGHASAGNLHFQLTPDLSRAEDRERYERFMERLVDLIVDKYDGSLKAEHGTGVNMAPYVEREWGHDATAIMWEVKRLADPRGVLNPGVILNRGPGVHLRDLKTQPLIEEVAAHCVECGFCEPVCPSRNVTTTPRQRIVLRREMARQPEGSPVYEALLREYEYDEIQTCAADGTCAPSCPLAIDTGKVVKEFRSRERSEREERVALTMAKRWKAVERGARGGLRTGSLAARVLGDGAVARIPRALRRRVSEDLAPTWPGNMPTPAP